MPAPAAASCAMPRTRQVAPGSQDPPARPRRRGGSSPARPRYRRRLPALPTASRSRRAAGRAATCRCRPAALPRSLRPARLAALRHAAICSMLFSTGTTPAATHSSSAPGAMPLSTWISAAAAKGCAQRQRLAELRDEECLAAFGDQRRRYFGRAKAIAVGLDDAGRRDTAEPALENPVIFADRPEVDRQDGSGHGRRRDGGALSRHSAISNPAHRARQRRPAGCRG